MAGLRGRLGGWLLGLTLVGACAPVTVTVPGDDLFESGDYRAAAGAYERHLAGDPTWDEQDVRALYRLALAYVLPESEVHDPRRADLLLRRLASDHAGSPYAVQASLLLELLHAGERLESTLEKKEVEAETLEAELEDTRSDLEVREEKILELTDQIEGLRREIGALSAQIAEKKEELRRLKMIDLEPEG